MTDHDAHGFSVLFVCTDNVCRSPVAELVTRRLLTDNFGSPGTDVDYPGDFSWGRSSSMGPQESMTRASAALAEWKP